VSTTLSRQSLLRTVEPLWIAALGANFVALGWLLLPPLIRMLGRGGAVETVEWATYMSTLVAFPPAVFLIGWVLPRIGGERAARTTRVALVTLLLLEFAVYAVWRADIALVAAAVGAAALTVWGHFRRGLQRDTVVLAVACAVAGWMAAGGLVYWQSAVEFIYSSPVTFAVFAMSVLVVGESLRRWVSSNATSESRLRGADFVLLLVLVLFSFRTFPMVEYFHWGFFVGPIEQMRQGGLLLWDTPSQYGLISILIPYLLPGNAWQSFWFFQSVLYAVVAWMMYVSIRRLAPGWWTAAAAFLVTFTTLFFRPRSESLILPAEMTPAAGPFRFIWIFVMLAFLVHWYRRSERDGSIRFAAIGTGIWTVALLWSAETAIYVSAMWFPALLVDTLQVAAHVRKKGRTSAFITKLIVLRGALPFAALAATVIGVAAVYRLFFGLGPDLRSYFDYVLLYSSGGFGALPIDPTGLIWYLVLAFLIVSTILAINLFRNPRDQRLVVWAASWGCIWAIASYFTGRSHPVNLIALIPVVVYVLVACLRLRPFEGSAHAMTVIAASVVPLLAMPVTLTAGHHEFLALVTAPQLSPWRFTEQIEPMDAELQALLDRAGAKPEDSFVLVGDGRLMLPPWRRPGNATAVGNRGDTRVMVTHSWMPKGFEIVGSLPENRRQTYFERNAERFPGPGWLIHSRTLTASGADHFLSFVKTSRPELARFESAKWVVSKLGAAGNPRR
jgi:hypothetical protein